MTGPFEDLLNDLSRHFHLKLHIDQSNACSILFPSGLVIQLQLDSGQENLFLFCKIAEIPPGKFRENVLMQALKANALPDPLAGILAFLNLSNHLALYQRYPLAIVNGERLAIFIANFLQLADSWRDALAQGRNGPLPHTSSPHTSSSSSLEKPFGLKP
ncbi:MAG TPA: CesT family type III secretion system chaperone [Chlamydiales bacterium]|nr:CesT family type III secretion system chaperone [Chlamydiales bacterium]